MERRRAGFRLPWTADGEETQDAQDQAAADTAVAEGAAAQSATSDATPAMGTTAEHAADTVATDAVTAADGTDEAERAEMETQPSGDTGMPAEGAADAQDAPGADTTATNADAPEAGADSTDFLASLVGAMRGVAESSRDASLAELKTVIDERIAALTAKAAEREAELRSLSDADVEAVGEWERTETERIRGEAETKRSERRSRLEQELTEHRAASERAAEEARSRLAQHERDLAAFFAQLGEITDPAAFVAAAKRMPRAPEVDDVTETPAEASAPVDAAVPATDPRLAALGVTSEEPTTETAAETAAETGAEAAEAATSATAEATDESDAPEQEPATATADPGSNGSTPPEDARLTERLAQLDQRLAAAPAQAATPAAGASADTSTAIVVKGLGSFGAITSFKQSLERVEGVRGVTLSLGPTGEFVYRASHAGDFDLVAAIQTLEGPTATIDDTDGTLVVTLSRAR